MQRHQIKRETDLQIISGWIREGQQVLDIGCGRGILLEHLMRSLSVRALGVDTDLSKVQSCVKRGVPVYHGEAETLLAEFPDQAFDWIILSRTIQELGDPGKLLREALRAARNVAVGFVNQGYWLNRWSTLRTGSRPTNDVFPLSWDQGKPYNPVTIAGFDQFTRENRIPVANAVFLKGDWRHRTRFLPNLLAGYAIYHLRSGSQ
jgi:methionine biosynthesis protein MetW